MSVRWKKVPSDPKYHDQWNAVDVDARIIECGEKFLPLYKYWHNGKYIGQATTFERRKRNYRRTMFKGDFMKRLAWNILLGAVALGIAFFSLYCSAQNLTQAGR